MLTVVSSPVPVHREPDLINALFESGLSVFHLRKPGAGPELFRGLLNKIHVKYHDRIALHAHHFLKEEFGICRLHFTGEERRKLMVVPKTPLICSTSIHSLEEYKKLSPQFSYAFLGPVFNSMSKTGYQQMNQINHPIHLKNKPIKIIGIGGITKSNGLNTLKYGFDGLAVLGFLWQSEQPVTQFNAMQKLWNTTGRL